MFLAHSNRIGHFQGRGGPIIDPESYLWESDTLIGDANLNAAWKRALTVGATRATCEKRKAALASKVSTSETLLEVVTRSKAKVRLESMNLFLLTYPPISRTLSSHRSLRRLSGTGHTP